MAIKLHDYTILAIFNSNKILTLVWGAFGNRVNRVNHVTLLEV